MGYHSRLKPIREERGLSEEEIAQVLETTVRNVRLFESGEKAMKTCYYIKLAIYYNISLDYIAGISNDPHKLY